MDDRNVIHTSATHKCGRGEKYKTIGGWLLWMKMEILELN